MKLPAFNQAEARWDRYKAFHNMHLPRYRWTPDSGIITLFDTGEMIVNNYGIYHTQRRHYPEWNMSILSPRDRRWPKVKAPDGTIVPPSYLTRGATQHFLIDHDSGHVVALGDLTGRNDVPERFKSHPFSAKAYVAGGNRPPVGAPVRLTVTKKLTKDERAHVNRLRAQCRAWMQFSEDVDLQAETVKVMRNGQQTALTWVYMYPLGQESILKAQTFMDLDPLDRCRLATKGTYAIKERAQVSHLLLA